MELFTKEQEAQLLANGHSDNRDQDHPPVVKLFLPATKCVWLISEIDPEDPDIAFGLCDLGMGFPELGSVSLTELQSILRWPGLPVMQDEEFVAEFPMSVFVEAARQEQAITCDRFALLQAQNSLRLTHRFRDMPKPT